MVRAARWHLRAPPHATAARLARRRARRKRAMHPLGRSATHAHRAAHCLLPMIPACGRTQQRIACAPCGSQRSVSGVRTRQRISLRASRVRVPLWAASPDTFCCAQAGFCGTATGRAGGAPRRAPGAHSAGTAPRVSPPAAGACPRAGMEPSSAPARLPAAAPPFWVEDFPSLPFGDGQARADQPDEAWSLDDLIWDPVVMVRPLSERFCTLSSVSDDACLPHCQVGARPAAGLDEAAAPPALLAPSLAAKSVALPGAPGRRRVYSRRPEVCHVPGCGVALSDTPDAPRYCFRFRICAMHLRAEEVLFPDGAKRHCQCVPGGAL